MTSANDTVLELLTNAKKQGVDVFLNENDLKVKIDKNKTVDQDLINNLKTNKTRIVDFLKAENKNFQEINKGVQKIPKYNKDEIGKIPLSFAQEQLWLVDQMQGSVNYHSSNVFSIKGNLNITILEKTIRAIIERHEVLRTVIKQDENLDAYQYVLKSDLWKMKFTEITEKGGLNEIFKNDTAIPFILKDDFLIRIHLVKLEEKEYMLHIVMHHLVYDGWSMPIFFAELGEIYHALSHGIMPNLEELPIQYADYAIWLRKLYDEAFLQESLNFWKKQLHNYKTLEFPLDYPRKSIQSIKGALYSNSIDGELKTRIDKFLKEKQITTFMFMTSVLNILLYKYTDENDICIGTPVANRDFKEIQGLIGYFVNTLPLRTKLDEKANFFQIIENVKENIIQALKYKEVPFEKIVDTVIQKRDLSKSPIFQIMLSVQNDQTNKKSANNDFNEIQIEIQTSEGVFTKFDLTFTIVNTVDSIVLDIEYCTDLFEKEAIERISKYFIHLIKLLLNAPEQSINDLDLITTADKQKLIYDVNTIDDHFIKNDTETILDYFDQQVASNPNAIAVISSEKNEKLTYKELNDKANKLAHYLKESYNIQQDDLVGIMLERSSLMIVAILGILKSGAGYLPIDLEYPVDRKMFMIENSKIKSLIISSKDIFDEILAANINVFTIDSKLDAISEYSGDKSLNNSHHDSLAYTIYTSGTSGMPKGVMIEHKSLVNLCLYHKEFYKVTNDSRVALYHGTSFDGSVWELFPYLIAGARLYPIESNDIRFDMRKLAEFIEENEITHIHVPTQIVLNLIDQDISLKNTIVMTGGEALKIPKANSLKIYNNYGPTEGTVVSTDYKVSPYDLGSIPIGKPIGGVSAYVLNKNKQLLPQGCIGELYIGGNGIARGYLGKEELTNKVFLDDDFLNRGSKMYKTGDLVRLGNDGNFEFKGRVDRQVKIRGYRIELSEIESVLMEIEAVSNAIVIDKVKNEDVQLVAYLVIEGDFDKKEIIKYMTAKVPKYMIPGSIVKIDTMPLNENGKIDFKKLLDIENNNTVKENYTTPKNQIEKGVTEIWEKLLGVEKIGINDDFFDLGGHSLTATKMIALIEREFDFQLPISILFEHPSIKKIADVIRSKNESNEAKILVPIHTEGTKTPIFCAPPGGGNVLIYNDLSKELGSEQPLYAFQSSGIDMKSEILESIEEMATLFIKEMQKIDAEGPYTLLGYSFGGKIIYEMALQLIREGFKVNNLIILDALAPDKVVKDYKSVLPSSYMKWVLYFKDLYNLKLNDQNLKMDLSYSDLINKSENAQLKVFHDKLIELGEPFTFEQIKSFINVYISNSQIKYLPEIKDIPNLSIILFKALKVESAFSIDQLEERKKFFGEIVDQDDLGWNDFTSTAVKAFDVDCSHIDMIGLPHIAEIAEEINKHLGYN
ncbi:amino acid adenylation domain-containing protein [Kordia sp. YSTF-M3]|uniref:Amino acid adenylation domain-containing protein n=1 Tax=Kordia aestuariivivens TaxID=2759037 RepID=A0ABR7QEE1_9FLAO|nr:non-ribosomal peptide synthetase [Kordia aestuariivivens]MBC8756868.1 amino acid adenylation domain-containing protein [Kordia aestuariivivens]